MTPRSGAVVLKRELRVGDIIETFLASFDGPHIVVTMRDGIGLLALEPMCMDDQGRVSEWPYVFAARLATGDEML